MDETAELSPKEEAQNEKLREKQEARALKQREKEEKRQNRSALSKALPWIILVAIVGAAAFVLGTNQFGWRDQYVMPLFRNVPILSNLLPEDAQVANPTAGMSRNELVTEVGNLQEQLTQAQAQLDAANATLADNATQIQTLKQYEAQQEQFRTDKQAFDAEVANGDPEAYQNYFAQISPENQDALYQQVIGTVQQSKEVKDYVNTCSQMDETAAAKMLEAMILTDMNLVVNVMRELPSDTAGTILSAMTPENAAAVYKQMSPAFQ